MYDKGIPASTGGLVLTGRSFARRDLLSLVSSRHIHGQQAQGQTMNGKPSGNSGQVTSEVAMLVS
jgi:hypothetical protein